MLNFDSILKASDCKISHLYITSRKVTAPSHFVCNKGRHLFDRFFYVKKGSIEFILNNGQKAIFNEKSIIYLPYDITYTSRWLQDGEYISVNFIFTDSDNQMLHFSDNISLVLIDEYNELIKTFEEIWNAQIKVTYDHVLLKTSLLYMLLYKIVKNANYHIPKEYERIKETIKYLEANYAADFDLKTLADKCNLSCEMFRLYFLKVKGMPPMKYKTQLRLEKARDLLSSKEYSVKEVSYIVGYSDVSYFSRIFKKEFGYPPVELLN